MNTLQSSTRAAVDVICTSRCEIEDRVRRKSDVIGSMIGFKIRDGIRTRILGITFLVREKVESADLSPSERIPKKLKIRGTTIITDVVVWPRMTFQSQPAATIIFDGKNQGTLSCFAASDSDYFGVSCAHCLLGADGNATTSAPIEIFDTLKGGLIAAGSSVIAITSSGLGTPGKFGYLDCGLFSLTEPKLMNRAMAGVGLPVVADIRSLVGRNVSSHSSIVRGTSQLRTAIVSHVEMEALGSRADVVLDVDFTGTVVGDSGMMWITDDGRAAAIHAQGEFMPVAHGSLLTTAMSASRAAAALQVQFLLG